jgi:hypothetical protein
MALIDEVRNILSELAPHGWQELFAAHGLDILAENLESELTNELIIERKFPGFNDFSMHGVRGIESGQPAQSLLYHALASPNVLWSDTNKTQEITAFASFEQLDTIENYCYALANRRLEDFHEEVPQEDLALVVFTNQYRSSVDTPHKMHADTVFSRTGIARVGTADFDFDRRKREFSPLTENPNEIRVLPAKYNLYVAKRQKGSTGILGKRMNLSLPLDFTNVPADENLNFWVPLHKIFPGDECLVGLDLDFSLNYMLSPQ